MNRVKTPIDARVTKRQALRKLEAERDAINHTMAVLRMKKAQNAAAIKQSRKSK